jgi:Domain of unknown function (DUF4288)
VNSVLGQVGAEDSVFLIKAEDFDDAFRRFISLGYEKESAYKNHRGEEIRKRFSELKTLDIIVGRSLEGVEIMSTQIDETNAGVAIDSALSPENSKPTQTI